jgi:hypothetical protein
MRKILFATLFICMNVVGQDIPDFKNTDIGDVPKEKLKDFKVVYDKFTKKSVVNHKQFGGYIRLYILFDNANASLHVVLPISGSEEVNRITILSDDQTHSFASGEIVAEKDVNNWVWRRSDQQVTGDVKEAMRAIYSNRSGDLRFRIEGPVEKTDHRMTKKEQRIFKEMMNLYLSL